MEEEKDGSHMLRSKPFSEVQRNKMDTEAQGCVSVLSSHWDVSYVDAAEGSHEKLILKRHGLLKGTLVIKSDKKCLMYLTILHVYWISSMVQEVVTEDTTDIMSTFMIHVGS